jgi:hypothetical protein
MIRLRQTDLNPGGFRIPVLAPVQVVPVLGDPKAVAESRALSVGPACHATANSLPQSQERTAKPKAVASSIGPLFLSNQRLVNVGTLGNGNGFVFHIGDKICPRITVQIEIDATRIICRISTRDLHEQFGDFLPLSFGSSFDDDYFDFFVSV